MLPTLIICSYVLTWCQWNYVSVTLIQRAVLQEAEHSGSLPVKHISVCLTLSMNSLIVLVWLMCVFKASPSQTQITQHLLGGSS